MNGVQIFQLALNVGGAVVLAVALRSVYLLRRQVRAMTATAGKAAAESAATAARIRDVLDLADLIEGKRFDGTLVAQAIRKALTGSTADTDQRLPETEKEHRP